MYESKVSCICPISKVYSIQVTSANDHKTRASKSRVRFRISMIQNLQISHILTPVMVLYRYDFTITRISTSGLPVGIYSLATFCIFISKIAENFGPRENFGIIDFFCIFFTIFAYLVFAY